MRPYSNEIKGFAAVIKKDGTASTRVRVYHGPSFTARSVAIQMWRVLGIVMMIVAQIRD